MFPWEHLILLNAGLGIRAYTIQVLQKIFWLGRIMAFVAEPFIKVVKREAN